MTSDVGLFSDPFVVLDLRVCVCEEFISLVMSVVFFCLLHHLYRVLVKVLLPEKSTYSFQVKCLCLKVKSSELCDCLCHHLKALSKTQLYLPMGTPTDPEKLRHGNNTS